jgi:hypothetical protein
MIYHIDQIFDNINDLEQTQNTNTMSDKLTLQPGFDAKAAYAKGSASVKKLLEEAFGKPAFEPNIMDRVKSFEDACKVLGIKAADALPKIPPALKHLTKQLTAQAKLFVIAQALNQGWLPDWKDANQYKWYPWFKMGAGFGFSRSNCDYTHSGSIAGSRLYFKSQGAGRQFESLYKDFLSL